MKLSRNSNSLVVFAIALVFAGLLAVLFAPSRDPASVDRSDARPSAKLLFGDEFNDSTLNTAKWVTCYDWYNKELNGCSNSGNDELGWYTRDQVSLDGGKLKLTAKKQDIIGSDKAGKEMPFPYVSGMISTGRGEIDGQAKWSNKYGYYEARMNVPGGKGIWPAFWLLPEGFEWPPEIDIMEVLGDKPNQLLDTYFWKDANGNPAKDSHVYTAETNLIDSWHTYAVDWTPGSLTWYLDGKKIRNIKSSNVPAIEMEMMINLAVGGRLPGNPDSTTPFPATMYVDYVRVYDRKP